jgi:hypothetical protein
MGIPLSAILPLANPDQFKMHLAVWNGHTQPLDAFVRGGTEWEGWNSWKSGRDEFNRPYILALMDFHPEPDVWLFGGIYEVLNRGQETKSHSYTVRLAPLGGELIGRLKLRLKRPGRSRSFKLENYYASIEVSEVLRAPYTGEAFPGYENICHDFRSLETIFTTCRPDWNAALKNVKGVYLIVDKKTGRKYVGSAYGDFGVWARWAFYMGTGHGWNDELTKLIKDAGIDYARENFFLTLLEYRSAKTDDQVIIDRECFWKQALNTRGEFGYTKN